MGSIQKCLQDFIDRWYSRRFFVSEYLDENIKFVRLIIEKTNEIDVHQSYYDSIKIINKPVDDTEHLDLKQVVCIGDVHGDAVHFLKILQDHDLISIKGVERKDESDSELLSLICSPSFLYKIAWNPKKTNVLILLLGDLCDDQRIEEAEPIDSTSRYQLQLETSVRGFDKTIPKQDGSNQRTTYRYIMEYVLHLLIAYIRLLALEKNSDIFTLFGNHEYLTLLSAYLEDGKEDDKKMYRLAQSYYKDYVSWPSKSFFQTMAGRADLLGAFYMASPLFAAHVKTPGHDLSLCCSHSGVRNRDDCSQIDEIQKSTSLQTRFNRNKYSPYSQEEEDLDAAFSQYLIRIKLFENEEEEQEKPKFLYNFLFHRKFAKETLEPSMQALKDIEFVSRFAAGHTYSCNQTRLKFNPQDPATSEKKQEKVYVECAKCNCAVRRTFSISTGKNSVFLPSSTGTVSSADSSLVDSQKEYFFIDTHISSAFLPEELPPQYTADTVSYSRGEDGRWIAETKKHTFYKPEMGKSFSLIDSGENSEYQLIPNITEQHFASRRGALQYLEFKTRDKIEDLLDPDRGSPKEIIVTGFNQVSVAEEREKKGIVFVCVGFLFMFGMVRFNT